MHPHASAAIRAAQNVRKWGWFATIRFLRRRGVPLSLFTLARVLENAQHVGV